MVFTVVVVVLRAVELVVRFEVDVVGLTEVARDVDVVERSDDGVERLFVVIGVTVVDEEYPESYGRLVEHLEKFFSQDIAIKRGKNGGGKIIIDFSSDADIEKFIKKFSKQK